MKAAALADRDLFDDPTAPSGENDDTALFRASDNLESPCAKSALRQFYIALWRGHIEGWSLTRFKDATGLKPTYEGNLKEELPPMPQFLNCLLTPRPAVALRLQHRCFKDHADQRGPRLDLPTMVSTCARDTRNCRAIVPGFTPASNAALMICIFPGEKGGQDRHVVLPICPRLVLLVLHGSSQGLGHAVHLLVSLGQLPAHESEPLGDASDVSDGGLGGSRRDRDRGLAQPAEHLSGVNTSHAMALQQAGDSILADTAGLGGRGSELPQFEEPCLGEIAFHGQNLRVVAPELLTHAVHQPGPLGGEIVGDAGPFPEFDHFGIDRIEAPEEAAVGPQRIGEHAGVATVVLGAGGREPVPEAVKLLGVERMHDEAVLHQGLDHRSVRYFNGNADDIRGRPGLGEKPRRHLGEPRPCVREGALATHAPLTVDDADLVSFRPPVDTDKPFDHVHHASSRLVRARVLTAEE